MSEIKPELCVLITNAFIRDWTGSELYVSDLATELIKRGHKPIIYSPRTGELAEELRKKSIPVVSEINSIRVKPDLIHGQHHMETMTALAHFPGTPAISFCHGTLPWEEIPPIHPRIIRYVTVSESIHDRLVFEYGIPAEKVTTILNSVDLKRFTARQSLPAIPKRSLVFSNHANEANLLGILRAAFSNTDITVDAIGYDTGNASKSPELLLGNYDMIFAVGRSALEALATGAAVICCGPEGVGPMVTTQNLDWLRHNNFGLRALTQPLTKEIISAEIQKYDMIDAQKVSQQVRATAGQENMIDQILDAYTTTIESWRKNPVEDPLAESLAFSNYLKGISDKFDEALTGRALAVDQTRTEIALVNEKARVEITIANQKINALQNEINTIKGTLTWRIYHRILSIKLFRDLYMELVTPLRRWQTRKNK